MLKIRMVEEEIAAIYPKQEMRSPTHLYIGQEAIATGVSHLLNKDDQLFSYYRSHGWYLAKGGSLQGMFDELFGKATGCSKGFGGSMHLIDLSVGFQGTTAVVGAAIPHALGAAFSMMYKKKSSIVVCCFGDGASEEGLFQESLMFAALRRLPVIFVCENNDLATNTYQKDRQPPIPIYQRGESCGVVSHQIDGNDVRVVLETSREAIDRARRGAGPTLIECLTYRMFEHCGPCTDIHLGFRREGEIDKWKKLDPLLRIENEIEPSIREQLKEQYKTEISKAIESARKAPFPKSLNPEESVSCAQ